MKVFSADECLSKMKSITDRAKSVDHSWDDIFQDVNEFMVIRSVVPESVKYKKKYQESFQEAVVAICSMAEFDLELMYSSFLSYNYFWNALARNTMIPLWMDLGTHQKIFDESVQMAVSEHWLYVMDSDSSLVSGIVEHAKGTLRELGVSDIQMDKSMSKAFEQACSSGHVLDVARLADQMGERMSLSKKDRYHHMYHQVLYGSAP